MAMPNIKNTALPEALLAEVRRLAKIEQRSPDELVQEAWSVCCVSNGVKSSTRTVRSKPGDSVSKSPMFRS